MSQINPSTAITDTTGNRQHSIQQSQQTWDRRCKHRRTIYSLRQGAEKASSENIAAGNIRKIPFYCLARDTVLFMCVLFGFKQTKTQIEDRTSKTFFCLIKSTSHSSFLFKYSYEMRSFDVLAMNSTILRWTSTILSLLRLVMLRSPVSDEICWKEIEPRQCFYPVNFNNPFRMCCTKMIANNMITKIFVHKSGHFSLEQCSVIEGLCFMFIQPLFCTRTV